MRDVAVLLLSSLAALCVEHAVSELWTADRDFSRIRALRTTNPLVG
ncbi:MAG: hypothetical protein M5U28_29250 [Sandaracinaceae bacterium]|nr:hypothetical protein [Sandaracinaceae bacterium]